MKYREISIIRGKNIASFLAGACIGALAMTGIHNLQSKSENLSISRKDQIVATKHENPLYAKVYRGVFNQGQTNVLEEIRVDECNNRKTIIFFTKTPEVTLSENAIEIYEGEHPFPWIASKTNYFKLPDDVRTDNQYRRAAKRVLSKLHYPTEMINGCDFYRKKEKR